MKFIAITECGQGLNVGDVLNIGSKHGQLYAIQYHIDPCVVIKAHDIWCALDIYGKLGQYQKINAYYNITVVPKSDMFSELIFKPYHHHVIVVKVNEKEVCVPIDSVKFYCNVKLKTVSV